MLAVIKYGTTVESIMKASKYAAHSAKKHELGVIEEQRMRREIAPVAPSLRRFVISFEGYAD